MIHFRGEPSALNPPIYPTPPAPEVAGKQPTASGPLKLFRLSTTGLNLPNLDFSGDTKPTSRIIVLLGLKADDVEFTTDPEDLLTDNLSDEESGLTNYQAAMPLSPVIAKAYSKISNERLDRLINPAQPEKLYGTQLGRKTIYLRFDQILALLALSYGENTLFERILIHPSITGHYLDELKYVTGQRKIVGNLACVLGGAMACALRLFENGNTMKYSKLGVDLMLSCFQNAEHIRTLAEKEANIDIDPEQPVFAPLKAYTEIFVKAIVDGLKEVEKRASEERDLEFTKATMQLGAYSAMVYQAASEHAGTLTKDAKRKAKLITICADLAIVGVTGAVASQFPPVLAVIPAAMTFVSTHLVPYLVPKTDFRSDIMYVRATMKASSLASITNLIHPREGENFPVRRPTIFEMQQRRFYHDMFFSAWEVVPDTRPRR